MRYRLTRYHGASLLAALTGVAILWMRPDLSGLLGLGLVTAAYIAVVSLGVCMPRLQFFGPVLWRVSTPRKAVAITFDDGPDPQVTPRLLEQLSRWGIPATFFCVGRAVEQHPQLARDLIGAGHELENHSYQHSSTTNLFSVPRLQQDLQEAQQAITDATSIPPSRYRPPVGLTNLRQFRAADALGLTVTGWTARGWDTRGAPVERVVERILQKVQPGAIILLHDGGQPAERVLAITEMLVDKLRAQGYECLRLSELVALEKKE